MKRLVEGNDELHAAVAYWGTGAADLVGISSRDARENIHVTCDLLSGACNPAEIKRLIELGVCVKTLDHLHAKVWLSDSTVIVGSANASTSGLPDGEDYAGANVEAALMTEDRAVIEKVQQWFFNTVRKDSRDISEVDLARAEALWEKRQSFRSRGNSRPLKPKHRVRANPRLRKWLIREVVEAARELCRTGQFDRALTLNAIRHCCEDLRWLLHYEIYLGRSAYEPDNDLKTLINPQFGKKIKAELGCTDELNSNDKPVIETVADEIVGSFTAFASFDHAKLLTSITNN